MTTAGCSGSSPFAAIVVDDDHAFEDQATTEWQRRVIAYRPQDRENSVITINSEFDIIEQKEEDIADRELENLIDLTVDDDPVVRHRRRRRQAPPAKDPERHHQSIGTGQRLIKLKKFYELDPSQCPKSALEPHFLLVKKITENLVTNKITITGLPFVRARSLMAKLPRKLNEVAIVYELDENDDRTINEQASIEVPLSAIIGPSRSLHTTNALYPHHRYDPKAFASLEAVEKEGPLVCRWKYFVHYRDSQAKKISKAHHWTLERVREHEVEREDFRVSEEDLRSDWRGVTIRGGAHDPETQPQVLGKSTEKQKYTVFDSFCGAGGFSRGAERAGMKVQHAVDSWDRACNTYRQNFPDTNLFEMTVDEFILHQKDVPMRVDVLHLSPPCQTWSPAHTVAGQNDEANIASLFACRSLVEKVRPRLFTLEQTFGILQPAYSPFFNTLLMGFTEFGYSVTWKLVHLQTWGLPQVRKRLIMIGACPGEKLPPFPRATHSETGAGGLQKYVTIKEALKRITNDCSWHNPEEEMRDTLPMGSVVSSPDEILKRAITCSGGGNMHYSNTRAYTVREFASLQGFPFWHQFAKAPKSALKKQIGNAFPACVVRPLYEHLKNWLLAEDGLAPARDVRASVGGREVVFLTEAPAPASTPRRVSVPVAMPSPLSTQGDSASNAMMLDEDEDDQIEIKFYGDSDIEMSDVPEASRSPDTPDTPLSYYRDRSRSRTMSLGPSPEPIQSGLKDSPIVIN